MLTESIVLSISRARSEDVAAVSEFHQSQATEFIWPRTLEKLRELADEGSLFLVYADDTLKQNKYIIGMCYLMEDEEPEGGRRWEFGGVCVSDEFRGYGIGTALGVVAITSHYLYEPPLKKERLIAHVHIDNDLPRNLLEMQLGFIRVGQEIPPSEVVPSGLRRNLKGEVVGDLYEFNIKTLNKFADWLEAFDGRIEGRKNYLITHLNLRFIQEDRATAIKALRQYASSN